MATAVASRASRSEVRTKRKDDDFTYRCRHPIDGDVACGPDNRLKSPWEIVRKLTQPKPRETSLAQSWTRRPSWAASSPSPNQSGSRAGKGATSDGAAARRWAAGLQVSSTRHHHADRRVPSQASRSPDLTGRAAILARRGPAQIGRR